METLLAWGERPSRRIWASAYFRSASAYLRSTPVPAAPVPAGRSRLVRDLVPPVALRAGRRLRRRLAHR